MALRGRYEAGVGCLVVVAAGMMAFMALQVGAIRGLGEHVEVTAVLDSAAGLSTGAVVSIAGVSVGRVSDLDVDFNKARVRLSLDADAQVRNDVTLVMRARSVLGEKYLEIVPNSRDAPLLADNDTIVNTKGAVEIDQLVTRMAPLVEALDPQALRAVGESLSRALAEDPDRPARMLADAERVLENAANASEALPGLVVDTRATLASVKKTSDAARPVIAKAEGAVARLDALLASVPSEEIPALLAELRGAVKEGRAVITRLDGSSVDVAEILTKLNGITSDELSYWAREEGVLIRLVPRAKAKK